MKKTISFVGVSFVAASSIFAYASFSGPNEFVFENVSEETQNETIESIELDQRLLPDLVPYPAKDLEIKETENGTHLLFTTMFLNQGRGPLELVADPETSGVKEDIERNVLQRIYNTDDTYSDKLVGTFLWHQSHLHYHYKDFIVYDLKPIYAPGATNLERFRVKSTFCIRDVSKLNDYFGNKLEKAKYLICGKELQGVSVGWADTYFNHYPDQRINISNLPSGTYRLSFMVNPDNILKEEDLINNASSVVFEYDAREGTIKVLNESPENLPGFEHIHVEQKFQ